MIILLKENLLNKKNQIKLSKYYNIENTKTLKKKNFQKVIAIFTKLKSKIEIKDINRYPNLKFILSPTTGLNHIDEKILNRKNIKVINLNLFKKKISKITSTSEYAITLILTAARRLLEQSYFSKKNIFDRYKYQTYQFKNQTVGIIGKGRIGKFVSKKLKYLGFNVISFDQNTTNKNTLKYLLNNSNIISIHINYSKENENFFNESIFKHLKNKPILINTSRGELINENDLIKYLSKGVISSAYLDVIKNEQKEFKLKKSQLFKLNKKDKIFLLPHLGGSTIDAMIDTENLLIDYFIKNYV